MGVDNDLTTNTDVNSALFLCFGIGTAIYFLITLIKLVLTMRHAAGHMKKVLARASSWLTVPPVIMSIAFAVLVLVYEGIRLHSPDVRRDRGLRLSCRCLFILSHATPALYASPYTLNALRTLLLSQSTWRFKYSFLSRDSNLLLIILANFLTSAVVSFFFINSGKGSFDTDTCFIYHPVEYFFPLVGMYCTTSIVIIYLAYKCSVSDRYQIITELKTCVAVWGTFGVGYFLFRLAMTKSSSMESWQWKNFPVHYIILINILLTFHQSFSKSLLRKMIIWQDTAKDTLVQSKCKRYGICRSFETHKDVHPESAIFEDSWEIDSAIVTPNWSFIPKWVVTAYQLGFPSPLVADFKNDGEYCHLDVKTYLPKYRNTISIVRHSLKGSAWKDVCVAPPTHRNVEKAFDKLGISILETNKFDDGQFLCQLVKKACHSWFHTRSVEEHGNFTGEMCSAVVCGHSYRQINENISSLIGPNIVLESWPILRTLSNPVSLHLLREHAIKSLCPELLEFFVAVREYKRWLFKYLTILRLKFAESHGYDQSANACHVITRLGSLTIREYVAGCNMFVDILPSFESCDEQAKLSLQFGSTHSLDSCECRTGNQDADPLVPEMTTQAYVQLMGLVNNIYHIFVSQYSVLQVNVSEKARASVAQKVHDNFGDRLKLKRSRSTALRPSPHNEDIPEDSCIHCLRDQLLPYNKKSACPTELRFGDLAQKLLELSSIFDEALEEVIRLVDANLMLSCCNTDKFKLLWILDEVTGYGGAYSSSSSIV